MRVGGSAFSPFVRERRGVAGAERTSCAAETGLGQDTEDALSALLALSQQRPREGDPVRLDHASLLGRAACDAAWREARDGIGGVECADHAAATPVPTLSALHRAVATQRAELGMYAGRPAADVTIARQEAVQDALKNQILREAAHQARSQGYFPACRGAGLHFRGELAAGTAPSGGSSMHWAPAPHAPQIGRTCGLSMKRSLGECSGMAASHLDLAGHAPQASMLNCAAAQPQPRTMGAAQMDASFASASGPAAAADNCTFSKQKAPLQPNARSRAGAQAGPDPLRGEGLESTLKKLEFEAFMLRHKLRMAAAPPSKKKRSKHASVRGRLLKSAKVQQQH